MTAALTDIVRVNQIGPGLTRVIEPDAATCAAIARQLDLVSLDAFRAELELKPTAAGWTLSGRVRANVVQSCGLTLEPLPAVVDQRFSLGLAESLPDEDADEIVVSMDEESPDLIEDGKIDLGRYAVEQLALALDPFPRKPGAEFVQPEEPGEISPFAVLKQIKPDGSGQG